MEAAAAAAAAAGAADADGAAADGAAAAEGLVEEGEAVTVTASARRERAYGVMVWAVLIAGALWGSSGGVQL